MMPPDLDLAAHTAYLRGLARALVGAGAEADDLVQDTLVTALEHPPRRAGSLRAWLATIARHRARDLRRGASRRSAREADVARPEGTPDASEAAERLDLAQRLAAEVARLGEPYRTAVYLRYHAGLAPSEIAARLGVPVKTVKTRLARALDELRARLDAREGGRGAWSALLLPLAFPRGAPSAAASASGVPLTTPLFGGLAVKKLALALVAVVALGLAVQGVRSLSALSRAERVGPSGGRVHIDAPVPAPQPTTVEVASAPRTPLEVQTREAATPAGALLATFVWAADGTPAADLCAELEVLDGGTPRPDWRHVVTDAEGRARFDGLPAGRVRAYLPLGGAEVCTVAAGETTEVRFQLSTTLVVEGRVVAPDGGPVGGAEIRAQRWDGKGQLAHVVARSAADGSFRAAGLHSEAALSAAAPGWQPSYAFEPRNLPVGPRGSREVQLELREPGGRLAGRVLDGEGSPVAGAQVLAGPSGGGLRDLSTGQRAEEAAPVLLVTAEDGTFELSGDLPPGAQPVEVIAAGHPVWFGTVDVAEHALAWLEVQLEDPARIAGRVLDAGGAPRAGVRVQASREIGARRTMDRTPVPTAFTDERGEFALDWVQPGDVEVRALDPEDDLAGRARARLECAAGELREVELTLDPEPAIRGRVVDAEGRPLAGWRVHSRTSGLLEMSSKHPGLMSSLVGVRSTDAEGRFVVPNADDLAWDLSVAAPGEFPMPPRAERKGVRAGAGEVELVVANATVGAPCELVVRLLDVDGSPAADVESALWDEHRNAGRFPDYDASTGVARWSMELPGRYAVQVRRGSRAVYDGELVELRAGETVDLGTIRLGEPGALVVEVSGPEAWGLEHVQVRIVPEGGGQEVELERDDLTFQAQGIAPGRYRLFASHKALFAPEREIEVRPGAVAREEVELVPALPVRVTFEFPPGQPEWRTLDWEVVDAAGVRVRSERMRNWSDFPGATAAPGIHGLGLPAGNYVLRAATDAGLRAELSLELASALDGRGPHVLVFRP